MPRYEFECERGHRVERTYPMDKCPKTIMCQECFKSLNLRVDAEKCWSRFSTLDDSKATVVFRDVNNRLSFPESADVPTPRGTVREEYKGLKARDNLRKDVQRETDVKHYLNEAAHRTQVEMAREQRHAAIKQNMDKITRESDNPTATVEAIKGAMEYSKNRKHKSKPKATSVLKVDL